MEQKNGEKHFAVMVDPELRMKVRAVALDHGMTMKSFVDRLFRLAVEADGVENLEKAYHERSKQ